MGTPFLLSSLVISIRMVWFNRCMFDIPSIMGLKKESLMIEMEAHEKKAWGTTPAMMEPSLRGYAQIR